MSDPATERTDLFLAASPANATILIDGYPLASNPGIVKFRRDGRAHSVLITAPGYRTRTERVVYDRAEVHLTVALTPDPKAHRRTAR